MTVTNFIHEAKLFSVFKNLFRALPPSFCFFGFQLPVDFRSKEYPLGFFEREFFVLLYFHYHARFFYRNKASKIILRYFCHISVAQKSHVSQRFFRMKKNLVNKDECPQSVYRLIIVQEAVLIKTDCYLYFQHLRKFQLFQMLKTPFCNEMKNGKQYDSLHCKLQFKASGAIFSRLL